MADFEDATIDLLNGNNGWVTNTNLFRGPMIPDGQSSIPVVACFVRVGSAPEAIDFENDTSEKRATVQIIIRTKPGQYGTGRTLAQNTLNTLHRNRPSGYFEARALTPHPFYLGEDDRGNMLFQFDYRLSIVEAS